MRGRGPPAPSDLSGVSSAKEWADGILSTPLPRPRPLLLLFLGLCCVIQRVSGAEPISPAFKWAQSPEDVHIYVKFAHKIDAPASNNFAKSNVKVEISENTVSMLASNDEKTYALDLELYKSVDPKASSYSVHTFGVSMVLKKKEKLWKRLMKDRNLKPRNMHLWWELYDKYNDEMEKLMSEAEGSGKATNKWWKNFDHKCEACHTMMYEAAFSEDALQRLKSGLEAEIEREAQKKAEAEKKAEEDEKDKEGKKETDDENEDGGKAEKKEKEATGNDNEDPEDDKSKNMKQALQVAQSTIRRLCEGYDTDVISVSFKKACKKLRKKRDMKKTLIATTSVVVEMLRKDKQNPLGMAKEGFKGNSTERMCKSVCPRIPKKLGPCKACNIVMDTISAHASKHKEKLSGAALLDGTCERIYARNPQMSEDAYESMSWVCDKLVRWFKDPIVEVIREKPSSERKKELVAVCKSAQFCKKKKKKKKNQDADESPNDESDKVTKEDVGTSPGLEKPTADEL